MHVLGLFKLIDMLNLVRKKCYLYLLKGTSIYQLAYAA